MPEEKKQELIVHKFPFGKYSGKGLAQTCLSVGDASGKGPWGFGYATWAYNHMNGLQEDGRKKLGEYIKTLNSFSCVLPCVGCGNHAPLYLRIHQYAEGSHIVGPEVYCDHACARKPGFPVPSLYRITYDSLTQTKPLNKKWQDDLHRLMLKLIGWNPRERVDAVAAAQFLEDRLVLLPKSAEQPTQPRQVPLQEPKKEPIGVQGTLWVVDRSRE